MEIKTHVYLYIAHCIEVDRPAFIRRESNRLVLRQMDQAVKDLGLAVEMQGRHFMIRKKTMSVHRKGPLMNTLEKCGSCALGSDIRMDKDGRSFFLHCSRKNYEGDIQGLDWWPVEAVVDCKQYTPSMSHYIEQARKK